MTDWKPNIGTGPVPGLMHGEAPAAAAAEDEVCEFDELIADSDLVEFQLDLMGEGVVYYPTGGTPRAIKAIIDRGGIDGLSPMSQGNSGRVTAIVANNSTTGISAAELDTNKDNLLLSFERYGAAKKQRRITRIISQDAGMIMVEIR